MNVNILLHNSTEIKMQQDKSKQKKGKTLLTLLALQKGCHQVMKTGDYKS